MTTKIDALCDALGNPITFNLSAGHTHDLERANVLLDKVNADALLADKAYDADERIIQNCNSSNASQ